MLRHSKKVLEYELPIQVEPQKEGGFVVKCPVWDDCYAQGDTLDEAVLEITCFIIFKNSIGFSHFQFLIGVFKIFRYMEYTAVRLN